MISTKYIGMDVHKESISIAVMNVAGKVVMECVIETKASMILQFIDGLRGDVQVTFEEGTSAAWLYDLLKPHVSKLVVCDPRKNKSMREGNQNDKIDARRLAELLRLDHLTPVYHGEHGLRTLKEMVRSYLTITKDLARVKSRVKAIYRVGPFLVPASRFMRGVIVPSGLPRSTNPGCAGELTLSFVPDVEQRLWRTIIRTKHQLTCNRVQLQNRLEARLEEAHIKLSSLVSDLLGASARRMLKAIAEGETDPIALADLADERLRATPERLRDALGVCQELNSVYRRLIPGPCSIFFCPFDFRSHPSTLKPKIDNAQEGACQSATMDQA